VEIVVELTLSAKLKGAVSRLAAPATDQVRYLREIGTFPSADELALEFDDLIFSRWRLRTECMISDEAASLVEILNTKLDSFSGKAHEEEWDASALESSRNWAEVRQIAKQLLVVLG
jgi:hypothetical protein